jgi:DNA-binding transcriptional ArsR family regulator
MKNAVNRGMNESCYGFFSALANPTRLAIMETLLDGELNVSGLAEALGQGLSKVSHNLKVLKRCDLVSSDMRSRRKYVTVNAETVDPLLSLAQRHVENFCDKKRCPNKNDDLG